MMHYGTLLRHFFRSHRDQCSAMDGGYIVNAFSRTCSINTKAAIRAPQAAAHQRNAQHASVNQQSAGRGHRQGQRIGI